jgi:hypothetical protein
VLIEAREGGETRRLVFSGDIGRDGLAIIRDPNPPTGGADTIICESTYGNRDHESVDGARGRLGQVIRETAARGGRILIPSFAVGRTQELVYDLHALHRAGYLEGVYLVLASMQNVRRLMAEKQLDCQIELEVVWTSDAIMKSNPLGKVPVLVMEGGEAVFDSRVIVEYIDTRSPVGKLIPETGRERTEVRTWEALGDGLQDAAILARLEQTWAGRSEGQRSAAWA